MPVVPVLFRGPSTKQMTGTKARELFDAEAVVEHVHNPFSEILDKPLEKIGSRNCAGILQRK